MRAQAGFIPPMLLLKTERLPDDRERWQYELKLDGYRAVAFTRGRAVSLRSRNDKDFTTQYPAVVKALAALPADTIVDGEIVALDPQGKPSFSLLQNVGAGKAPVVYFVFDVMRLAGRDLTHEPLRVRRALLEAEIVPLLREPVRHAAPLDAALPVLIESVRKYGFEGLIAKRVDSVYESGLRSGAWQKMRVNQGQELVIGGYTLGATTFDALIVGYYDADRLLYVARTRNGFTPASRVAVYRKLRELEMAECPFVNLPEPGGSRWHPGLTAEKMKSCRWVAPELVAQIEYVEWTPENHLRHSRFIGLRADKPARDVTRETVTRY
jgi:bifunctional non-homologous end joining protein LigD